MAFFLFLFVGTTMSLAEERLNPAAPSELPNTTREMKTAGFWISRHPSPDTTILSSDAIDAFNARIQNEQQLTKDIFKIISDFKTESLATDFEKSFKDIKDKVFYDAKGVKGNDELLEKAKRNMDLPGVVLGIAPRYGLIVHYAEQRFLPTTDGLYALSYDIDFDELQNSSLDVGTPVAVVHQSLDKKWVYVLAADSDGWVKAANVAVTDMKTVQEYAAAKSFGVVLAPKADIFLDKDKTQWVDYARTGTRLPITDLSFPPLALSGQRPGGNASVGNPEHANTIEVLIPTRGKEGQLILVSGYMDSQDIHAGYLPFTPRMMIKQAFRLLNSPYGWGGMYGEQDCSAFMQEIFSTTGIHLPRDSKNQALVGREIAAFDDKVVEKEKMGPLNTATPGITILPMKGHILLYLGMVEGKPYAIHAVWAYRQPEGDKDIVRVINKITVSDLSLGQGSKKGSLLRRLSAIREVR